jgi:hypothetical protein
MELSQLRDAQAHHRQFAGYEQWNLHGIGDLDVQKRSGKPLLTLEPESSETQFVA